MTNSHAALRRAAPVLAGVLLLAVGAPAAFATDPYDLSWFSIDAGGGSSTDGSFTVNGTIGQPDTGRMTGAPHFSVMAGYWGAATAAPTCACDLNSDGQVDDSDFVIFASAYDILDCTDPMMPLDCPSDFNGDAMVDDNDFVIFVDAYNELLCP